MDIKLIATDVDDTLVEGDHITIPEDNIKALRRAHDKGVKIAIASGRTGVMIEDVIDKLGCVDYIVVSSGSVVRELSTEKVIFSNYFKPEVVDKIIDILEEYKSVYEIYCDNKMITTQFSYDYYDNEVFVPDFKTQLMGYINIVDNIRCKEVLEKTEKINIVNLSPEKMDEVEVKLKEIPNLDVIRPYPSYIEMTDSRSNKAVALGKLCDQINVTPDEVMCLGDSNNDASMLKWAGYSVAMGNAPDNVKKIAKYTTDTCENAGVARTIERFVFNERTGL